MRKLVSLWGYMRSHTSSSSADITMHWALEEHCRKTSSAPIPGDGECLDTEMWSALWLTMNIKVCGLRQQVVVHVSWIDQHAKRMVVFFGCFFFFSPSIKMKDEHFELRFFFSFAPQTAIQDWRCVVWGMSHNMLKMLMENTLWNVLHTFCVIKR